MERILADFESMWRDLAPIGRSATSGGYFRQPWRSAERECLAWFHEQARRAGWPWRPDEIGNAIAWWRPERADRRTRGTAARRADRLPPRLGARRRRLRRTAGRRLGLRRDRPAARARLHARAADRGGAVPRGGGLALRHRLPGLAAGHRGHDPRAGRAAARPGRRLVPRRAGGRRHPPGARRDGPRVGPAREVGTFVELHVEQGRDLVHRDVRRRGGQRDLAARSLPLRLRRRGQPCGHDADGGPARPDAQLCDDRAGGQQAGPALGPARDLRPHRRAPQRHQRGALPRHRLARRPRRVGRAARRAGGRGRAAGHRSARDATAPRWRSPPSRSRGRSASTRTWPAASPRRTTGRTGR